MQGPSILGQLAWFLIITLIYSYLDYSIRIGASDDDVSSKPSVYLAIYMLMALVGQYFITVSVSVVLCGAPQYYSALFATFLPWVFIFGTMLAMLAAFPGWILPLSNTIGYAVANGMGMGKMANDVFIEQTKDGKSPNMTDTMKKALSYIYTDKASLLNNITPSNFNDFWEQSKDLRRPVTENAPEFKKKFRDFVILKHAIGTVTWYLLTGALVISVSYNYMVNSPCSSSVRQIAGDAEKLQAKQNKLRQQFPVYKESV
jgi:hypothetical protein